MRSNRARRRYLQLSLAAITIALMSAVVHVRAAEVTPKKLNVLFIVSDDLTTTALGTYGQKVCQTPNIDRLAARGVRFDRAYCNYPVCNPSRTSFLSGRYPESTRVLNNNTNPRIELGKDHAFLPEYFKAQGYFTAGIGKVAHGGFSDAVSWDVFADPQHPGQAQDDEEGSAGAKGRKAARANKGAGKKAGGKKRAAREEESSAFPWEATSNDDAGEPDGKTARRVAALIEQHKDGPFFIAAGFHKPHVPHTAPKKYFDLYPAKNIVLSQEPTDHVNQIPKIAQNNKYNPETTEAQARATISHYFAATTFMDTQVGLLLDTLERLDLWKSTIVVFIGDHGWHFGEHGGYWAKGSLFDESARAPLIVAAPTSKSSAACSQLVEFVDIYPTLTELVGLPTPGNLQGSSFAPLLADPQRSGKKAVYTVVSRGRSLGRAVRTEKFTYLEWPDGSTQLYDYGKDSKEYVNLSDNPDYAQTKAELKRMLSESGLSADAGKVTSQSR